METRSGKRHESEVGVGGPVTESNERENIRDYFAMVEDSVLKKLTKQIMNPDRIRTIAEDALSDTILRIDSSLRDITQGQEGLRKELDALVREPCKCEFHALRDELTKLRGRVEGEFQKLWSAINTLQEKSRAREPNEPLGVRDSDIEIIDSSSRRNKGRESGDAHSRRSSAKGSRSSKHKRRRDRLEESDSDSTASSSESDADLKDPDGDEIRVADKDCRKVLNVNAYRLIDRDPERDLALRTTKVLTNLRHLFDGERFDGSDPLTVLPFLEELKSTFDDAGLSEGDARHMIRYFLTGEAARLFKSLAPRDRRSYPRIVKWLLRTYVRENMLQNAREKFLTRSQKSNETELEYSKALSDLAKRCAGMIPARDLTNRFIRGLRLAIRTQVQSRMASNTSWAVAVAVATEYGDTYREAKKDEESRRDPPYSPLPRKKYSTSRGKAFAVCPPRDDDSSDAEQLWSRGDAPTIVDTQGDKTIGAIRQDSALMQRDASYASLPTSVGSSSERYYTPRPAFIGRDTRDRPSNGLKEKVMLPPGVPFPAKKLQTQAPPRVSAADALPCLGCGQVGHWLSDCPNLSARLKDLALEGLRARKQARKLKFDERRDPSPGRFRRVLPVSEDEPRDAPTEVEERDETTENTG